MPELSREEVLKIAKECGIDGLNPMGFYMTDIRLEWLERFAAAIYSKGFAAGAEDMRERADDAWAGAIQADLENGVKWLNEKAAKSFRQAYPELAKLGETIRAIPITTTNKGEQE